MDTPFVSAVCVTGKSPQHVERFLPRAIRWFQEQDYPADRRELLLVTDAPLPELEAGHVLQAPPNLTLGDLRNIGLDHARGDLIIQWDDDDYHGPGRISAQAQCCVSHGGPVFLASQVAYSWDTDVAFIRMTPPYPIMGTILHEAGPQRYPSMRQHEDTHFAGLWPRPRWAVLDADPRLYVRFSHDANTSGHLHTMREAAEYRPGTWAIPQSWCPWLREVLAAYTPSPPTPGGPSSPEPAAGPAPRQ